MKTRSRRSLEVVEEEEGELEDGNLEACPSKVCTVEAFEGVAAHHAADRRPPHAALRSHLLRAARGR